MLFGWHLTTPAAFDREVRDLWLKLGDLDGMTRKPLGHGKQSLLRGDGYFYPQLREAMKRLASQATGLEKAKHPVRLLVTATRLQPRRDAVFPRIGSPLTAGSSRAFFRFRYWGDGAGEQGDFGTDQVEKLAYVGRTTSSFPGAFEPAMPFVGPPDRPVDAPAGTNLTCVAWPRRPAARTSRRPARWSSSMAVCWTTSRSAGLSAPSPRCRRPGRSTGGCSTCSRPPVR